MIKIHMKLKKATKGTHVYEEVNKDGTERDFAQCAIPSLYIRKSAMPTASKNLTITVEVGE